MNIIQKLKDYKTCFFMNANISEYLGIAVYKDKYIEIYEYYDNEDENKFIIEENGKIAAIENTFDFTEAMFLDWVEQRKFELSNKENIKDFKKKQKKFSRKYNIFPKLLIYFLVPDRISSDSDTALHG